MGVCGETDRKKNPNIEGSGNNSKIYLLDLKGKLLNMSDDAYCCTNCDATPEFVEIDCNNQNIIFECKEHGRIKLDITTYLEKLSEKDVCQRKCEKCQKIMKDSKLAFYHCFKDDKVYCQNDLPKNNGDNSLKNKDEKNQDIENSGGTLNLFCKTCNIYISRNINHQSQINDQAQHEIIPKEKYEPNIDDLNIIYLFQKILSLVITSYEKKPDNYYNCVNVKNMVKFLKKSLFIEPKTSIIDKNNEKEIMELFDSIEENKKTFFNKLYRTNITGNEEIINLRDKQIGDFGLKLLCKMDLRKLQKLILVNNNISNIEDLKFLNSYDLKTLNLAYNSINNIDVFKDVHFSLNELNLNCNMIEDINILKTSVLQLKNFKELNLLKNNFHNENNNNDIIKLKLNMKNKNVVFKSEKNDEYSRSIKCLESLNKKYSIDIKINDTVADLSSVNKNNNDEVLKQLMHPNVLSLKLSDKISIQKVKESCISLIKNFPKLNSISNKDSVLYLRNDLEEKFQGNIFDLKFIKELSKADNNFESAYTFVVFNSIKTNKVNLIYFQTENENPCIKLINDFENIEPQILHPFEKGTKLYEIKYYIDTINQNEIIITSSSYLNSYKIILWELKNEKLISIYEKEFESKNQSVYFCMISDTIIFNENYIISNENNQKIIVWNNKKMKEGKIIINTKDNVNLYFIGYYNYCEKSKYYIIIGVEKGFISYEFNIGNECKKYNTYTIKEVFGEYKNSIVYENENAIYLIGIECKSHFICLFDFDEATNIEKIPLDFFPSGLNLWNNQYLIISNKSENGNSIQVLDLDDKKINEKKIGDKMGAISTIKIKTTFGECLVNKGLNGDINLWNC